MRNIVGFVVTVAISARCGRFRPGNSSVAPTLSFLAFCFPITVSIQIAVLLYPTYCHSTFLESASRHVTALSISKVSICLSLSLSLRRSKKRTLGENIRALSFSRKNPFQLDVRLTEKRVRRASKPQRGEKEREGEGGQGGESDNVRHRRHWKLWGKDLLGRDIHTQVKVGTVGV